MDRGIDVCRAVTSFPDTMWLYLTVPLRCKSVNRSCTIHQLFSALLSDELPFLLDYILCDNNNSKKIERSVLCSYMTPQ